MLVLSYNFLDHAISSIDADSQICPDIFYCMTELQKSCGYAGITHEEGSLYMEEGFNI